MKSQKEKLTINKTAERSEEFKCHINSEVGSDLGRKKGRDGLRRRRRRASTEVGWPQESPGPWAWRVSVDTLWWWGPLSGLRVSEESFQSDSLSRMSLQTSSQFMVLQPLPQGWGLPPENLCGGHRAVQDRNFLPWGGILVTHRCQAGNASCLDLIFVIKN